MSSSNLARECSSGIIVLITFCWHYKSLDQKYADELPLTETLKNDSTCLDKQKAVEGSPAVRFSSANEEISPQESLNMLDSKPIPQKLSGESETDLRELSSSLRATHLQNRRMSAFNFEPVSLPASRVCANLHIEFPFHHFSSSTHILYLYMW